MDSKNIKYLAFTAILLILSVLGIFFIFKINSSPLDLLTSSPVANQITQTPTSIPTKIPTVTVAPTSTSSAKITTTPTASPTAKLKVTATPTIKITPTLIATPTAKVTTAITPTATPTTAISEILNFKSDTDGFSIDYSSSRKLYQDTESTGNRYTFYNSAGNFAVHVSSSGTWSWTNPDRNFNADLIVSGQNTYRYDISTQTIVDLQSSDKNYTIQCVHNGKSTLKAECETFIQSFKLL